MTPAERAKWVAGDDPAANAAPDMGNDVEDAAAAAQAKGNDVLAGENQPPPAKKKKASTLMNFSAISGRKFLLALLKTFNLMVVPPYAATGRKVAARDEV